MSSSPSRLESLRSEIARHDDLYFRQAAPKVSDTDYDKLKREFESLGGDSDNGDDRVSGFGKVKHARRMKSLDKAFDASALATFLSAVFAVVGGSVTFSVSTKYDGLAVSAIYRNGKLARLATRGNGDEGDDITANAHIIDGLPAAIPTEDEVEIRGEAYMLREVFAAANAERARAGLELLANPRNAAAGVLKTLELPKGDTRRLEFACYDSPEFMAFAIHSHEFSAPDAETALGVIRNEIAKIHSHRDSLPFDIDGVVIAVEGAELRQRIDSALNATAKFPKWAVAYKFEAEQAQTVIRSITFQVGRTGAVTPVANFDATPLAGSTVRRATLHNADEIARKGIREGDTVVIEKRGDIIPAVVRVIEEKRPADSKEFDFEARLKELGLDAVRTAGQASYRLVAPSRDSKVRAFHHFMSKGGLNVMEFGTSTAESIVDFNAAAHPVEFVAEPAAVLEKAGIGGKTGSNLLAALDVAKREATLNRVIFAFGIPNIGTGGSKILARRYPSLAEFSKATYAEMSELRDFGPITSASVEQWLANPENQEWVAKLIAAGVNPVTEATLATLSGKVFVLTGTLPTLSRDEATAMIEKAGGKVSGSVSGKTSYVLAGEASGSKLDKARTLGVPVISESDFLALAGN